VGTLRRATPADAEDLTRLRGLMHLSMGVPSLPEAWRVACSDAFRRRLAEDDDFVVYGVDVDGRIVASGAGWIEHHLPSPTQLDGRRGHIASMSTDPEWQRKGLGRQVFQGLVGWFAERDVRRIDLRATDAGRPLYEEFGFQVLGGATMAWTAPGVSAGMR
jgi:GNAT superfamily N-acetyltransferase